MQEFNKDKELSFLEEEFFSKPGHRFQQSTIPICAWTIPLSTEAKSSVESLGLLVHTHPSPV